MRIASVTVPAAALARLRSDTVSVAVEKFHPPGCFASDFTENVCPTYYGNA
jgi:hypothetical protein